MSTSPEVLERYKKNRMRTFALAVSTLETYEDYEFLSFEGRLLFIIDFIENYNNNQKAESIRKDVLLPNPCAELADFSDLKTVSQAEVDSLLEADWSSIKFNQVVIGTDSDKNTEFGCAIANAFIDKATKTKALSLDELLDEFRVAFASDSLDKKIKEFEKSDLLYIYNWGLSALSIDDTPLLALFINKRKKPLLISTDLGVASWHEDVEATDLPQNTKLTLVKRSHYWHLDWPDRSLLH